MRKYIFISICLVFCWSLMRTALADSAPIDVQYANSIQNINIDDNKVLYTEPKKEIPALYYSDDKSPKNVTKETKKTVKEKNIIVEDNKKKNTKEKNIVVEDSKKKNNKNINVNTSTNNNTNTSKTDRIISTSKIKISALYPRDIPNATNTFPGYRGTNQLVVYERDFGSNTGTNEFGKEAVVEKGIVTKLTGANSNIPRNGFVISGHGSAKKWISDNLKIGTKIEIQDEYLIAYTTIDSYRYYAKHKINQTEDTLISTKVNSSSKDDKYVYYYLKKAKQQYKKSLKDNSDNALYYAKQSIESATMAYRYTLPYISSELKGTWIRPTQKSLQEVQQTLDLIKNTGINNVFLETYFHGKTIFPSKIMQDYGFTPQNPEFSYDVLGAWVKEAHKRGIKVHVWFESFYVGNLSPVLNPNSILSKQPEWMNRSKQKADVVGYVSHPQEHNGYFLDPANPEVVAFLLQLINEIASKYSVDGFNIDYERYPNVSKENFSNQWGYTKYAREEFKALYDVDPVEISTKGEMWDNWCEYRRGKVTDYVRQVSELLRSKNIMFSTVVFPDYKVSLQTKHQDWANWASRKYVDAITPLILTSDDELAHDMLEEIKKKAMPEVKVYPGLFAGFIESDPEDLLKQIHIIRKLKLNGIILFDWAHLNSKYLEVLKTSAFKS